MSITLPDSILAAVSAEAKARGRNPDSLMAELVDESLKMRQVPGIVFADGPTGRRARIEGTGIDVFEIVEAYRAEGEDRTLLDLAYHWLDTRQLDAALTYFRQFPEEIERHLAVASGRS